MLLRHAIAFNQTGSQEDTYNNFTSATDKLNEWITNKLSEYPGKNIKKVKVLSGEHNWREQLIIGISIELED